MNIKPEQIDTDYELRLDDCDIRLYYVKHMPRRITKVFSINVYPHKAVDTNVNVYADRKRIFIKTSQYEVRASFAITK